MQGENPFASLLHRTAPTPVKDDAAAGVPDACLSSGGRGRGIENNASLGNRDGNSNSSGTMVSRMPSKGQLLGSSYTPVKASRASSSAAISATAAFTPTGRVAVAKSPARGRTRSTSKANESSSAAAAGTGAVTPAKRSIRGGGGEGPASAAGTAKLRA